MSDHLYLKTQSRTFPFLRVIWDNVSKNGAGEICGRQPLKNFTWSILKYFVPSVSRKSNVRRIIVQTVQKFD